jgi:hypothetical protein
MRKHQMKTQLLELVDYYQFTFSLEVHFFKQIKGNYIIKMKL